MLTSPVSGPVPALTKTPSWLVKEETPVDGKADWLIHVIFPVPSVTNIWFIVLRPALFNGCTSHKHKDELVAASTRTTTPDLRPT